jgi:nitroreductase
MHDGDGCMPTSFRSSSPMHWDRRQVLLALAATPLAAAAPSSLVKAAPRSLPNASDHAQLKKVLSLDEFSILTYASFAPSGHNTQPWTVLVRESGHWSIGTRKDRWLPAVDPANRETTLSVGAFLENLVIAAQRLGYAVDYQVTARTTTETRLVDLKLRKASVVDYPIARLETRRTLRSGYSNDHIKTDDLKFVTDASNDFLYVARDSAAARSLNEATIEANRKQTYRDAAQEELANWIRWSSEDQERYRNGLTPAGMEINGIAGWYVSTFYDRDSVLKKSFRETGVKQIVERVAQGGGWLVQTGGSSVAELIETGRKFQRMWLKLRERGLAIHPMTQVLEEAPGAASVAKQLGVAGTPQFVLRIGYVKEHPDPVSPRRPVAWFTTEA